MQIIYETQLDYSDVLILPKRTTLTSRSDVDITRKFNFLHSSLCYEGFPVIVSNMDSVGVISMADALKKYKTSVALHKHYSVDTLISFFKKNKDYPTFYSIGMRKHDVDKLNEVKKHVDINWILIDVPNGYMEKFSSFVKQIRKENKNAVIMAGNVVTGDMTQELLLNGADIVKIGIGSGAMCTTRKIAGTGRPQLSAAIECADSAHGLGGLICSDGGLILPGDFSKGFGGGSDFLMGGSIFAGHDECDGEFIYSDPDNEGKSYISHMKFYGMSSKAAMDKYYNGVADYKASEGREALIPYKGPIKDTIEEIQGGVRSTLTYTGSKRLKELSKRTTFVMVNRTHNTIYGE